MVGKRERLASHIRLCNLLLQEIAYLLYGSNYDVLDKKTQIEVSIEVAKRYPLMLGERSKK